MSFVVKDPITEFLYLPAFEPGANAGERFVVELPSDTQEAVTVGKSVDGRLPCAVMDAATLAGRETQGEAHTHAHTQELHSITYTANKQERVTIR